MRVQISQESKSSTHRASWAAALMMGLLGCDFHARSGEEAISNPPSISDAISSPEKQMPGLSFIEYSQNVSPEDVAHEFAKVNNVQLLGWRLSDGSNLTTTPKNSIAVLYELQDKMEEFKDARSEQISWSVAEQKPGIAFIRVGSSEDSVSVLTAFTQTHHVRVIASESTADHVINDGTRFYLKVVYELRGE